MAEEVVARDGDDGGPRRSCQQRVDGVHDDGVCIGRAGKGDYQPLVQHVSLGRASVVDGEDDERCIMRCQRPAARGGADVRECGKVHGPAHVVHIDEVGGTALLPGHLPA